LSESVVADFARLQDRLFAFPGSEARCIIEVELGRSVLELFICFDDEFIVAVFIV